MKKKIAMIIFMLPSLSGHNL